jgi:hypothetical protein
VAIDIFVAIDILLPSIFCCWQYVVVADIFVASDI